MANRNGFRGERDGPTPYVHSSPEGFAPKATSSVGAGGVLVNDPDFTLYVGDVLEQLRELPDESVHCVVTSPPYWGLRCYGVEGQYGLEATPDLFVARMVDVFREIRRVLRADGTCWVNLGDSYAQSGDSKGDTSRRATPEQMAAYKAEGRSTGQHGGWESRAARAGATAVGGLKPKDLVGIPWRVAFALQADGWYLRSDIVWSKPNPMPESVTDRPTKAHEYVFLLTKGPRYFFDQEAVREDALRAGTIPGGDNGRGVGAFGVKPHGPFNGEVPAGRNVRSVWEIATQPYPEAHFATFPEALPDRCIRAGTSERGCCPECGAPWERETERESHVHRPLSDKGRGSYPADARALGEPQQNGRLVSVTTTGWRPSCVCDTSHGTSPPAPCTVLDPFMGSGTTALVARRLGRRSIGIELNPSYAALCARRLQQLSLFAGEPA